ncbi:MAG: hypothetical protein GX567_19755 [Clostridia bacterium]|nr:hypothetical protein [Clostridia bacterium]
MAFNWKGLIGTVAPTIATALGGPLAGLATKAVAGALGLTEGADEAEIAAALQGASPETLMALKTADQDFAVRLKELDIDLERINAADRDSARRREVDSKDPWTPRILGGVIIGGFFATVFAILFGYGVADSALAGALIGYVSAKAEQVVSYYFGSSSSSQNKDSTIASMKKT